MIDQNAESPAWRRDATGAAPITSMLGGTGYQNIASPSRNQSSTDDPIGAPEDPTAASRRLVFDEIAGTADLIESFAIGLREAARRGDRVRVHGYISDIVRCVADARGAYPPPRAKGVVPSDQSGRRRRAGEKSLLELRKQLSGAPTLAAVPGL